MRERFRREAQVAAGLNHPSIVTVHAVKERAPIVFFDLKLIEGASLDRMLKSLGHAMPFDTVRWLTARIAEALHYAHGKGVVHRDIKPANVMVDVRGEPIVTDFGIARATESPHFTVSGTVVGTPAYMSPEQCLGDHIAGAADQYSLGVLAYELLTGRVPFGGTMFNIQLAHTEQMPTPPHLVVSGIPADLSAIVMRMLAKAPDERWPSMADLADVLHAGVDKSDAHIRRQLSALVAATPSVQEALTPTPLSPHPLSVQLALPDPADSRLRRRNEDTEDIGPARHAITEALGKTPKVFRWRRYTTIGAAGAGIALAVVFGQGGLGGSGRAAAQPASADTAFLHDTLLDARDSTVTRVAVDPLSLAIAVGDSVPLRAAAFGPSGEAVVHRTRWSTRDSTIVKVADDGWIRGVARGGPVFVYATVGRRVGVAAVTVY
jgi:hypothetical protein